MKVILGAFFSAMLVAFAGLNVSAQISADFSPDATEGCGVLLVNFTDLSTGGTVDSYSWDFGDGSPLSTLPNPAHFYSGPGTYTVSLTVTSGGDTDTEVKAGLIEVWALPVADFTVDATSGCEPLLVSFTDASIPGDGTINDWIYDFGDGSTATSQSATHSFSGAGPYSPSLLVTDDNGCQSDTVYVDLISTFSAPTAAFTVDNSFSCTAPLDVTITDASSGTGISYAWDFGDATTDNTPNPPTHTYSALGTYNLQLVVTDAGGCTDTASTTIVLADFVADFTSDVTTGCVGSAVVNFQDQSSASAAFWAWDFGDGVGTATTQNPAYAYSAAGTYTVTLIAADASGCVDTTVVTNYITIGDAPTVAIASSDSSSCQPPFPVNFSSIAPTAASYFWTFGDGAVDSVSNPQHTYTNYGQYSVQLQVTDAAGCVGSVTYSNFIQVLPIGGNFFGSPNQALCIGDTIQFVNTSTVQGADLANISWDFGDGSPIVNGLELPQHAYSDSGSYTITLIIENQEGCTDTVVSPGYIKVGMKPVAAFVPTSATTCFADTVQFMSTSSSWVDVWQWNFNPGAANTEDVSWKFQDTGLFDVQLIVSHYGCSDTAEVLDAVNVLPPIAVITGVGTDGCENPHTIDTLSGLTSVLADTYTWDFGPGATPATAVGPIATNVTFTNFGNNPVKLIVTNTNGCIDSTFFNVRVSQRVVDFSLDTNSGCNPHPVAYASNSFSNYGIADYFWWFGDGDTLASFPPPAPANILTPTHVYDSAGVFTPALYILDALGCLDSLIGTTPIDVKENPVADFTTDTTIGCEPLLIQYTSLAAAAPGSNLVSHNWSLPGTDSVSSSVANPLVSYPLRGTYGATLTVTDNFNCVSTISMPAPLITVSRPYTNFSNIPAICNGDSVVFTNTTTGDGVTYSWDFGDGTSTDTSAANFSMGHVYDIVADTSQLLTITLYAVDTVGCDSTFTQTIDISVPVARPTADSSFADCPPFTAVFTDSSSADVVTWQWDFGDGTNVSSDTMPTHFYPNAGVYDITLIVANALGCTDSVTVDSLIRISGPSGTFTDSLQAATCFGGVIFTAETQDAETLQWVFGDGGSANGDSVLYQYSQPGTFTPVLALTDSAGCQVNVIGDPLTIPVFTIFAALTTDSNNVLAGTPITFIDDGSTSSAPINTWAFDFGDSTTTFNNSGAGEVHVYDEVGSYTTRMIITDDNGCVDTAYVTVTVTGGIIIPNVFTPNNDGYNDEFAIPSSGLTSFTIWVYNRWGELVFQSDRANQTWTGRTFSGEEVPAGTYYYILQAEGIDGEDFSQTGNITLFR